MTSEITRRINRDTGIPLQRIDATISLIQEGATIPFIARYRKEAVGNLDEAQLRQIAKGYLFHGKLAERRSEILAAIESLDRLTPELSEQITACDHADELEDLYLPYRSKRQSKANLARRRGLEPLADYIHKQSGPSSAQDMALRYISFPNKVPTVAAAIEGALHIVAERISEDTSYRKWFRDLMLNEGTLEARVVKGKEGQKTKYSTYYNFSEPVAKIPSHRLLAIRRGTREKVLSYTIQIDDQLACAELKSHSSVQPLLPSESLIETALTDSYERLLKPVIQNEVRNILRNRAEDEAIKVFEENLRSLLLAPPAGPIAVLGVEPNLKGGSRLAVVGPEGLLVEHHRLRLKEPKPEDPKQGPKQESKVDGEPEVDAATPTDQTPGLENQQTTNDTSEVKPKSDVDTKSDGSPESPETGEVDSKSDDEPISGPDREPQVTAEVNTAPAPAPGGDVEPNDVAKHESASPAETLVDILKRTQVRGIVIGNGTGSRPAETFVRSVLQKNGLDVFVAVTKEAGAAVYASSRRARQEFPNLDAPSRGAVSIARRLQDPLAELVKIDPKSIGVGQYQHDVDQDKLKASLGSVVESAVNQIGVDLNDASADLLTYISGLSPEVVHAIVNHRKSHGRFSERDQLKQVPGIDEKVFEQAAGFLRIKDGTQPLDRTSVHPECYPLVEKLAESIDTPVAEIVENSDRIRSIKFQEFEQQAGRPTLVDIRAELLKPGRDPRKKFAVPRFREDVQTVADLKEGMELEGNVTNVTNFGAFVDVGVQQDGLVHISELAHQYVSDARRAAQVGDVVKVKVIGVDSGLKRISLSIKGAMPKPPQRPRNRSRGGPEAANGAPSSGERGRNRSPRTKEAAMGTRKRTRGSRSDRSKTPSRPKEPVRQLSMEEKIRLLQEKFKGPDK